MKFSRERFQNGSFRPVPRKTGPDVWEFRYRDHSKPGLPMRQITLSTLQYPTETAARRALQAQAAENQRQRSLHRPAVTNLRNCPRQVHR